MPTGLILEGGGLRGLFTAGITDVMLEAGLHPDAIIGVSAGALFGCNIKSHQPGRSLRYNLRYKDDPRYMGLRSWLTTGNYVNAQFAYHTMPLQLDPIDARTYAADPTPFWLVLTDITTGTPLYRRVDTITPHTLPLFQATGSMPVFSRPVIIDGRPCLDGGLTDCIPLRYFQHEQHCQRNIVILTRPQGYRKTPAHLLPLFTLFHPRHPAVRRLMAQRHLMYNAQLDYVAQQETLGHTLVIRPDHPLDIGRIQLDEAKMRAVYQHGRDKATELLPQLRAFMAEGRKG